MTRFKLRAVLINHEDEPPRHERCARSASLLLLIGVSATMMAQDNAPAPSWGAEVQTRAAALEQKLIAWRRDIHQHPELGDQEQRTGKLAAEHLRGVGLDVRTGVARTGVVGILKGAKPGPTVALRADMDALPVKEATGEVLAGMKGELPGTVVFIFQPAKKVPRLSIFLRARLGAPN
jgi:amidohydrolase